MTKKIKWLFIVGRFWAIVSWLSIPVICFAIDDYSAGVSAIAGNVTDTFSSFARLITALSFLAGLGLAFVAILKFKEYRDSNPGQGKLGVPVAYLLVAAAFLFLPHFVKETGTTVFGPSATPGSIAGETSLDDV